MKIVVTALISCLLVPSALGSARTSTSKLASRTPEYALTVRLSPEQRRIHVSGTLRLPASSQPQEQIVLEVSSAMQEIRAKVVEPAEAAGPITAGKDPTGKSLRW